MEKLQKGKINQGSYFYISYVTELGRDYKPDKLDKYILKRYGPKGKYLRTEDIPEQIT